MQTIPIRMNRSLRETVIRETSLYSVLEAQFLIGGRMANQTFYEEFTVVKGPSKFDLMLALFDVDLNNERQINFNLLQEGTRKLKVEMKVDAVHRVWSHNDQCWDITGEARFNDKADGKFGPWYDTRVEFFTKNRRGILWRGKMFSVYVRMPGPELSYCNVRPGVARCHNASQNMGSRGRPRKKHSE